MQVIRLTAEHASPYRDLMLHGYAHAPDAFTSTPAERATFPLSWWVKRVADPESKSVAFGVFSGEHLVGTVALEFSSKPKTKHKVHLIGMYVLESYRGKGIGRQLILAAVEFTLAKPETSVIALTVTEGNASAIALYESAGFVAFGVEPMAVLTAGGYKGKVHMWREVTHEARLPCTR